MAKSRGDFTDVLIRRKILGGDQLDEAVALASSTGLKLQDALAKLNYVTPAESMSARR